MDLEDRYALGAEITVSLSSVANPRLVSRDPEVVRVGPTEGRAVTLEFVGTGMTTIEVSDADHAVSVEVEVAEAERFEVVLVDWLTMKDGRIPLQGKALINPAFQVVYSDDAGRLYGRGLAETPWEPSDSRTVDVFQNPSLEQGIHQVEVRVGEQVQVSTFLVVKESQIVALDILETDLGGGRIRVDGVGRTQNDLPVWNIAPYFEVEGEYYGGSFQYVFDPSAEPSIVTIGSAFLFVEGQSEIRRADQREKQPASILLLAPKPHGPMWALLSLLLMVASVRALVGGRLFRRVNG